MHARAAAIGRARALLSSCLAACLGQGYAVNGLIAFMQLLQGRCDVACRESHVIQL